jgi:hypothetical protein
MIVIGMIDIHDIKTEQDAITVTEEVRKVCFIKKWQAPLINMKKGFKMLESLKKSEDSMLSELFDIT